MEVTVSSLFHTLSIAVVLIFFASVFVHAQEDEFEQWWQEYGDLVTDMILELPREFFNDNTIQELDGRLFAGIVDATITDADGNPENFEGDDEIYIEIWSSRSNTYLKFDGMRVDTSETEGFDEWVHNNFDELIAILFPTSLSEGIMGADLARHHSQQFLSGQVLDYKVERQKVSGLLEYEWFEVDGAAGSAV